MSNGKTILDLCAGSGAWSEPYREAGYDVIRVTLPDDDVRLLPASKGRVYGILAAPPCTHFAVAGARWWRQKGVAALLDGLSVVDACMRIITICRPVFWALENPAGRLAQWLGPYKYTFQPYEYGDPWTKRTCIWGEHNIPKKNPVAPVGCWHGSAGKFGIVDHPEYLPPDWIHRLPPSPDRAAKRSITPPGFARAFFEANQ